jgi:dienelactone hydrolase
MRLAVLLGVVLMQAAALAWQGQGNPETVKPNQVGAYGPWLAEKVLGDAPGRLSLRTGKWNDVNEWRQVARRRVLECIAPVDLGGVPAVTVTSRTTYDGLDIEFLTWQLPNGPRTEAVLLKPTGAQGRLPGILALHDHGGNKYLGWRKIVRTEENLPALIKDHQQHYYGGAAWANEIAKRGYVVLVHDTFVFGSRRVQVKDVLPRIQADGVDPKGIEDEQGIKRYNAFAGAHEHQIAKSLTSAGTTWPGMYVVEDQRALDVLASRSDVDASRLGTAGLSGGGLRAVMLGGLDDRIKVAVPVGFMTTWRDLLLDKAFTHTWMTYVPLLPKDLEFGEILALRAPAATMVLNSRQDALFTLSEMERADRIMAETFQRAKASDKYRTIFYDGGHKFDRAMQADAFDWFDRFLRPRTVKD